MMFLCPAFLDRARSVRCGLPAEARCRFTMCSTDGPLESAMIRCPVGHHFSAPVESLIRDGKDKHDPCPAPPGSRPGRDSRGRDAHAESAVRVFPADRAPGISRSATAPAYYLGHPARVWINAMRSPRARNTSGHRIPALLTGNEAQGMVYRGRLGRLGPPGPLNPRPARVPCVPPSTRRALPR